MIPGMPATGLALGTAMAYPCGHPAGCDAPATHQAPRPATPVEADAHWDAQEAHIRAHGTPEYVKDRAADTVTVAEFRCDHPEHAHPGHLEALAAAEAAQAADNETYTVRLTTEQHRQLLQLLGGN